MKKALLSLLASALLALPLIAQDQPPAERSFNYPEDVVNLALTRLNAPEGRLPTVEGFAQVDVIDVHRYSLPYYQLQTDVKDSGMGATLVRVSAHITALYNDSQTKHSEYRSLPSSGRLEQDLLERLARELGHPEGTQALDRKALEGTIASLKAERQATEQKRHALTAELEKLVVVAQANSGLRMVGVEHRGAQVYAGPSDKTRPLFRAQSQDEFEMVREESGWSEVQLAPEATGWIRSSELHPVEAVAGLAPPRDDFAVIREDVMSFSGNWAELKGKATLFVYVRPRATSAAPDRWAFARQTFLDRAETAGKVDGIVVVFLGDGGVAAATLRDIRRWSAGAISDNGFRNRCSLDPPRAFDSTRQSSQLSVKPGQDSGQ